MNFGKNLVLSTWGRNEDGNTIWYPSFYDCDSILGLANNGKITFGPGLDMDTGDYNTSNSALWTKLKNNFGQEIRDRYRELRMSRTIDGKPEVPIFSSDNLMRYYGGEITEQIGENFYNKDADVKYLIPESKQWIFMCSGDRRQYTERWLKERFLYMDSVYEFESYINSRIILRSNVTGNVTLRLKSYSPQHILVSFSDSSSAKMKKYVDKDRWYDFTYNIGNGRDNNIFIAGASNIMYVNGIENLNASFINIGQANKLVSLDCSGSTYIQQIALADNPFLQSVKCNKCPNLGMKLEDKVLDLEKCINLRHLNCSETKIGSVRLNSKGGVIDYLNCSNTDLTSFSLMGQEYLTELALDNCRELAEIVVDNCNNLNRISMPNSRISKFVITGCDKLDYVDISQTKFLSELDLRGCPNIKTLKMKGVSNPALSELDLSNSLNIEYLDVSSNSFLKHIIFGRWTDSNGVVHNYNKLKHFDANSSTIQTIRYVKSAPIPDGLNLSGFSLTFLNLSSCTDLTKIQNINYTASGSSKPFYNCQSLVSIHGTVRLTGNIDQGFYGCKNLVTLPTLDLTNVTSMSDTFNGCEKITMQNAAYIFDRVSSKLTYTWRLFAGCKNISGTIPSTFFSKCSGLKSIEEIFIGLDKITGELHVNLLRPMVNLEVMEDAFAGTSIGGMLPETLLSANIKLKNMIRAFARTKVTNVPGTNFFRENRALQDIGGIFNACKEMNGVLNDRWFVSLKDIRSLSSFMSECPGVTGTIPPDIFNNIAKDGVSNKLGSLNSFIAGTSVTGAIPETLFKNCRELTELSSFFARTNVAGEMPKTLVNGLDKMVRMQYMFDGCSGLNGNVPSDMFKGKKFLTNITAIFKNCSGLYGDIPKGLLDDCIKLTDISEMFYGCRGLNGTIPKRVSEIIYVPNPDNPDLMDEIEIVKEYGLFDKCTDLVTAARVFANCKGLRTEIPETLLINATKVVDLSGFFEHCYYIYGPIPEKLFKNCYNVQKLDNFFAECCNLSEYLIDEENPYCMPETIFDNCFNLLSARYFFGNVGGSNDKPNGAKLKGAVPPKLFDKNTKLRDTYGFFWGVGVTGEIPSTFFKNCRDFRDASHMFRGCSITSVGDKLFEDNRYVTNLSHTFSGCSKITSNVPSLWTLTNATTFDKCFSGCTNATNYNQIPSTWK